MKDLVPKEGATGWVDTWMLSAHAKNPNCAYKWMAWVSTPKVQAQQAIYFGETPANKLACASMDKLSKGSCAKYHANAPRAVLQEDQVLEDADRHLRRRQERLHRLHEPGSRSGRRSRGSHLLRKWLARPLAERGRLGGVRCRHRSAAALGLLRRRRSPRSSFDLPGGAASSLFISAFWTVDAFTGELVHTWTLANFQTLCDGADVPHDRAADDRDRGAGHGRRRAARVPVRVLHGPRRLAARLRAALFVAVLVPLWSSYLAARLRLAADPRPRRNAQLVARARSGCRRRTSPTRTGRCGSCSPTSGCRS